MTAFGPPVVIINAFVLIGLDLTTRDVLHDAWRGRGLRWKMAALIATGGALSWLVNPDAGRIALASTAAFVLAASADAAVYHALLRRSWFQRANVSNVVGAAVDSIAFPSLAFGALLPGIIIGQFAAKVAGGFVWSMFLQAERVESPQDATDGPHGAFGAKDGG